MRKKKVAIFAVMLCLAAGTWETLSYMNDGETTVNRLEFAGENGINARLTEPSWKPQKGLLTVPGTFLPKDPQVTNTSEINIDELVALKCEFVYTDNCPDQTKAGRTLSVQDMEKVTAVYSIDYNSDSSENADWIRFEGQTDKDPVQCFYYRKALKRNLPEAGETTVPLFTRLLVPYSINNRRQKWIQDMGGFEIKISGQVIQQMKNEEYFGLDNGEKAYEAGVFNLNEREENEV